MSNPTSTEQNAGEPVDTEAWAREFSVTKMQIEDAVKAVGNGKADVEMYLKGSHATTDSDTTQRAG